jgi:hypothetical protein
MGVSLLSGISAEVHFNSVATGQSIWHRLSLVPSNGRRNAIPPAQGEALFVTVKLETLGVAFRLTPRL